MRRKKRQKPLSVTGSERSCSFSRRELDLLRVRAAGGIINAMPAVISSSPGAAEITAVSRLSEVASVPKYRARAQSLSRAFRAITTHKVARARKRKTQLRLVSSRIQRARLDLSRSASCAFPLLFHVFAIIHVDHRGSKRRAQYAM